MTLHWEIFTNIDTKVMRVDTKVLSKENKVQLNRFRSLEKRPRMSRERSKRGDSAIAETGTNTTNVEQ